MRCALPTSFVLLALMVQPARSGDELPSASDGVGLYRACGLNCLAVVLHWRGTPAPMATIESRLRPQANGDSSVADIERAAQSFGLQPTSILASMRQLPALPLPAIVQLRSRSASSDATHFIVVVGLAQRGVVIVDAPRPPSFIPYDEFARVWSGVAISFPQDQAERDQFLAGFRHEPSWAVVVPVLISGFSVVLIGAFLRSGSGRRLPVVESQSSSDSASIPPVGNISRVVLVIYLVAPLVASSGGCSRTPGPPHLALANASIDLGIHEAGSMPFTIPIRNSGDGPLLIYEARSSCACTVAEVPKTPILTQQGGEIRGRIAVRSGEGSAEVLIATNEPEGTPRRIRLTWFGKHVPTLAPETIEFTAQRGEVFERTVELSYPGGDTDKMKVDFLGVDGLPPATTLTLQDNNPTALQVNPVLSRVSVAGRATFRLRTRAPEALGDQRIESRIKIRQHGVQYDLPLTLAYHVDEGVRAVPANLTFSGSSSETLGTVRRQVVVVAAQPLGELAVVSKPEYLDLEIRPRQIDRASVVFRINGSVPPGVTRGEVVLCDASGRRVAVATTIHYLPESGSESHASASR